MAFFVLSILIPLVYSNGLLVDPNVLNSRGISLNFTQDWTLVPTDLSSGKRYDLAWIFQFIFIQRHLHDFCVYHTAGSLSYVKKKRICRKKIFNTIFLITMFFGGGMIPTFILINQLHMVNTIWAILLPGAFNIMNMILAEPIISLFPRNCGSIFY